MTLATTERVTHAVSFGNARTDTYNATAHDAYCAVLGAVFDETARATYVHCDATVDAAIAAAAVAARDALEDR